MKQIFFLLLIILAFNVNAKIKYKTQSRAFTVELNDILPFGDEYLLIGKIKQQIPSSFDVDFSDIRIWTANTEESIQGKLMKWNDYGDPKIVTVPESEDNEEQYTISLPQALDTSKFNVGEKYEFFIISFPKSSIKANELFNIKLGTICDSYNHELHLNNIKIKNLKKKKKKENYNQQRNDYINTLINPFEFLNHF